MPDDATGYNQLELDPTASGYVVREEGIGTAQAEPRRTGGNRFSTSASSRTSSSRTRSRPRGSRCSTPGPFCVRVAHERGPPRPPGRRDDPADERVRAREPARRRRRLATARWTSRSTPATPPTASRETRPNGCGRSPKAGRSPREAASIRRPPATRSARRSTRSAWSPTATRPRSTRAFRTTTTTSRARPSTTTPISRSAPFATWPAYPNLMDEAQTAVHRGRARRAATTSRSETTTRSCRGTPRRTPPTRPSRPDA